MAPEEMPTRMPSSVASAPGHRDRVVGVDVDDLVVDVAVEDLGHEVRADALDLVRAGAAAVEDRRLGRLHADDLTPGLRSFSTWPTPVMVPPVPMPATKMSTPPSVSSQISSAVVRRWISGFAGFSNCRAEHRASVLCDDLLGLLHGAAHALRAGREHELGAERAQQHARSVLIVSGIVSTTL